jgi:hypothetical protein
LRRGPYAAVTHIYAQGGHGYGLSRALLPPL